MKKLTKEQEYKKRWYAANKERIKVEGKARNDIKTAPRRKARAIELEAIKTRTHKECTKCCEHKSLSEFNKNGKGADGYLSVCRLCNKAIMQALKDVNPEMYERRLARCNQHKRDNKEHIAKSKKAWDEANSEHLKEYRDNAYWSNPEVARARAVAYRKANPEACRQSGRAYAKAKSDVYVANKRKGHAKRRAAKVNANVSWADNAIIIKIYKDAVTISKETGIPHHVDHIVPLLGKLVCGLHVENNLQIITAEENSRKTNTFAV